MFAALYRLLSLDASPSMAELSALGFELDPHSIRDTSIPDEDAKPGDGGSTGHDLEQRRETELTAQTKQPDWSFPLVIVERRQAQDTTNPEHYLSDTRPFDPADDKPLCEPPETSPLLSRTALSRALLQAFTQPQFSGRIDTRRLSERAAARRPLTPIARKPRDEPVQRFWLLIDSLPELAWDIDLLQQQFSTLPVQQRPQHQIRLTPDAITWFDAMDQQYPLSQLHCVPEDTALLVVGDPLNPSRQLSSVLRRLCTHSPNVTWLSPRPHHRAVYWGDNRVSADNHTVVEQMKTLLWPFPMLPRAMVRDCRLALGGSTAAEQSFWLALTKNEGDLLIGYSAIREDRERYQQRLRDWLKEDCVRVQQLYHLLRAHIDSMSATFRYRAMLNLPDALVNASMKEEAERFFASLAMRVVDLPAHNNTAPSPDHRHLCAVIAQMADGQINPRSNRLNAAIQIGQRGYSRYDKDSAIQIANAADALSHRSLRGWVTLRDNILRLSSNASTGTVAALDVSEDGLPVEANEQRSLIQFGDPLPSSNVTLHSPTERIDILRTDSQRFHYAESLWQDQNGLHLRTQEKLGIGYPAEGGGPQFDMSQAPAWLQACPCGIDEFGLWAELNIAGMGVIMRWIGPGQFDMGSPYTELDRDEDEVQHPVTLSEGYWLAETSCTQALWQAVMGENPSHFKGANRPVDSVSWDDVQRFLQAVNVNPDSGLQLVLPTEAQWEYACRAGTQTPFNLGATITPEQVNYDGNFPYGDGEKGHYRGETVDAKSFAPNAWGLYQMHGNVWEWCNDWYGEYASGSTIDPKGADTGDLRVLRGGSWISHARNCRSAIRDGRTPSRRYDSTGFRFAQVTPAPVGAERPQAGETKAPRSGESRGLPERLKNIFSP